MKGIMFNGRLVRVLEITGFGLLLLTIILLPVTSLPFLSKLMGDSLVAPPSVVTAVVAAPIWLFMLLTRRKILPREILPWLAFITTALISSALGFFLSLPPFHGFTLFGAAIDALLSFSIGATCYLIFATWFRDENQFSWIFRFINLTGFLILIWSIAQLVIILFRGADYPGFMVRFQALLSVRPLGDPVYNQRVSAFAYEPSWLAHQLNTIYLPFWLAASFSGYSAFRKFLHVSLENVLLLVGFIVLIFSYSRVGLAGFLLALAYCIFWVNRKVIHWLREKLIMKGWRSTRWLNVIFYSLVALIYIGLIFGLLSIMSFADPRIAHLLELQEIPTSLLELASKVDFAERVLYWGNGWQIFARYPWFGVGLGNSGFFFAENMVTSGLRSTEVIQKLYLLEYLPNIKSLWIRLFAETGLVGTSLFLSWYILLWAAARNLTKTQSSVLRTLGWMGSITLITFLAEGFSIDSFALPYLWISLGLLTSASALARRKGIQDHPG